MKFIDEVQIRVSSGHGGPGWVSFRREAFAPRGGPDGGDGGKGGDVILRASRHLNSLMDFRNNKRYAGAPGNRGENANCSGLAGEDMILHVPDGTIVRNIEGEVLVDMTGVKEFVLLKGGRGGKGNHFFRTSVNQSPEHAQPGEEGQDLEIKLELKLIADVGIIGFPNAGKSTLISRVSAARPKIADYPFTTLTPNLGVVKAGEYKTFVVADIPGLVKGAHQGVGLGIQFLRHIERTRLFIHLIDASGLSGRDPVQDYEDINNEIRMYDESNKDKDGFFPLTTRPQFVVFNKIDTLQEEDLRRLKHDFQKRTGIVPETISAVAGRGVKELVNEVSKRVFEGREDIPE
jgi:GTP-binding protein